MSYWLSAIPIQKINATTYTIRPEDNGSMILSKSNSAVAVTCPNDLPPGFNVAFKQKGTGQITFAAASGATLESSGNEFKSARQKAVLSLFVEENEGASALWTMTGEKAA